LYLSIFFFLIEIGSMGDNKNTKWEINSFFKELVYFRKLLVGVDEVYVCIFLCFYVFSFIYTYILENILKVLKIYV